MRTIWITIFFLTLQLSLAQVGTTYYVSVSNLNLRSEANVKSKILLKLKKYDNVRIVDDLLDSNWVQIKFDDSVGYVYRKYIKKGKAEIYTYTIRTGAVCRDGTTSTATGRGACSHHGGVSRWITRKRTKARIIDN